MSYRDYMRCRGEREASVVDDALGPDISADIVSFKVGDFDAADRGMDEFEGAFLVVGAGDDADMAYGATRGAGGKEYQVALAEVFAVYGRALQKL